MHTIRDIVEFVVNNRKDGLSFKDWTTLQIINAVDAAMLKKSMIYGVDDKNSINAVMIGSVNGTNFRVVNILTLSCGLGKQIVVKIAELFPQCSTITFTKRGRERTYPLIEKHLKHVK